MKTAIYIEDGVVQLVITPQTEFEKNALSTFEEHPLKARIFTGSFYGCQGGWIRQKGSPSHYVNPGMSRDKGDRSLILRIDKDNVPKDEII